jgi:type III restriction enzyme
MGVAGSEKAFMKWTQAHGDFVCWLRNLPRRDWAFCVSYENGGEKPFYPDFLIVRKKGKGYVVDVADHKIRDRARKMGAPTDLAALFEECIT